MSKHPAQPAAALKPPDSFMARLTRSRWMLALAATLIALPAVWLLIVRGLPAIADDTPVHLMRLFVFDQQVRQGEWLPRWIPDLYIGYGYPLFNFYAPAMYYVAETLHLGGLGQAAAYGWSYVLAVILGAVGAAFLASDLYASPAGAIDGDDRVTVAPRASPLPSFWPGLLAAAAYTYATYLLANVFVRGAFGEIGAQALLPWLFWSLRRMMLAPRRGVASLAPSVVLGAVLLALLAMTHTISFLLALPCLATYAIVLAMAQRAQGATRWHTLAAPAAAAVLAALLSAVIWLPQLLERGSLSESAWSTQLLLDNLWRWRDFTDLDLRFRAIDGGQTPYQLSVLQAILLLLGLIFTRRRSAEWWLWVAILAVCGLLVSPLSAPLWANVTALAIIQFPWRLLSLMGLAVALIGAGVATAFPTGTARAIGASLLVALIVITQAPRPGETPFLTAPDDITLTLAAVNRFEQAEPAYGAGYDDEFLPKWANVDALMKPAPALPPIDASVRVEETWHTGGLRATAEAASPIPLMSSQFYFPGWQKRVDTGAPSPAAPDAATGLVRSDLPAGDNALEIARATTTAGQAGGVLAGIGLVLLLVGLLLTARRAFLALATTGLVVGFVWLNGARPAPPLAVDATVDLPMPAAPGLDLAGIDGAVTATGQLAIRPTWFVRAGQPDLLTHWRLTDNTGRSVGEVRGTPRFGTWNTSTWRPGALMQDAAELGLPPGLPAGEYTLHLALVDVATGATVLPMQAVLRLDLPAQAALEPTHDVGVNFGMADGVPVATLGAVRVAVDGTPLDAATTVAPGATVGVDLLWQQLTPDVYPYQSLVEIVDHAPRPPPRPPRPAAAPPPPGPPPPPLSPPLFSCFTEVATTPPSRTAALSLPRCPRHPPRRRHHHALCAGAGRE